MRYQLADYEWTAIKSMAEADWIAAIAFWRYVGPRAFLHGKIPDPVGVIAADEAVIARCVWTKRLRQITPGCSGSQHLEDAVKNTTVVYARNATRLVGQQGRVPIKPAA